VSVSDPTTPAETGGITVRERRPELERGAYIDRYIVLKLLGRGGMGAVYAAHDPKLDRQVALKVLHSARGADAAERMVQEARALARLDDPHVVQVFDAGEVDGTVFIAMQLVDGEDLASALRRRSPGVAQLLAWFVEAGRGLAAAHAAGLVHRDFKPNNVLMDRRGRIAVTDFGIARDLGKSKRAITAIGSVMGTPAYMSPEQHSQLPATEASDQFAFCVSLWEALFDQHPFVDGDRGAMSPFAIGYAIFDGALIPPRRGHRVPRRVVEALTRGLSHTPSQRWSSMNELLVELEPPPRRRLWPIAIAGGLAAIGGGAAMFLALHHGPADDPASCASVEGARVEQAWSATAAGQIADRFAKSGKPYAQPVAQQLRTGLDHYAEHWRELAGDVCTAERAAIGPPIELVVRRRACVDSRLDALRALVNLLSAENRPEYVDHAQSMVDGLPDLEACNDTAELLAVPGAPPAALASQVEQLGHDLTTTTARGDGGELERAKNELAEIAKRADALGWAPLQARAHLAYAKQLAVLSDPRSNAETARAAELATANHLDREAAEAISLAVFAAGNARQKDVIAALAPLDRAMAVRTGDRYLPIGVDIVYGRALARLHDFDGSLKICRAALATAEKLDRSVLAANARDCLLESLVPAGAYAELQPLITKIIETNEKTFGPDHPITADYLHVRANIELSQGKLDEGCKDAERVLEIRRRSFGPQDVKIADALDGVGDCRRVQNNVAEERKMYEQALEVARAAGDTPLAVDLQAQIHQELAFLAATHKDHKGAIAHFEQGIALTRQRFGSDSLEVAFQLLNYGQVKAEDDYAAGLAALDEGRKILEAHHDKRAILTGLGMAVIEVSHHKWAEARAHTEKVLAIPDPDLQPEHLALAQWLLAQSLVQTKGDRKHARELAQAARATYAKLGPDEKDEAASIDKWLAKH
jgi:tetratricopeptide (TPR) repeat protein